MQCDVLHTMQGVKGFSAGPGMDPAAAVLGLRVLCGRTAYIGGSSGSTSASKLVVVKTPFLAGVLGFGSAALVLVNDVVGSMTVWAAASCLRTSWIHDMNVTGSAGTPGGWQMM